MENLLGYGRNLKYGPFLGRLLISLIFILSDFGKLFSYDAAVNMLAKTGANGPHSFYIGVALLFEIVGGLLILLGWYTRVGCFILMVFLLPTTFLFHNFWTGNAQHMMEQLPHFLKNLAIYGGLILLASFGPGSFSLDAKRCTRCCRD